MMRLSFLLFCLFLLTPATAAQPQNLPDALKPWVDWVVGDDSQFQCPFAYQDFQQKNCSWPGALKLTLTDNGGHFSGEWQLYSEDWITLPGDDQHWPQQVLANRLPTPVIDHDGKPSIRLPAGHYQIDGVFNWDTMPENLTLADDIGLIKLSINDREINHPRIEQGAVWLAPQSKQNHQHQQNSLDIQVFRQIVDSIPLQVTTQLELDVSGAAREVSLPHALLPQFIPIRLDSPLPARLEADGRLSVMVRPGHWSLSLLARHPQMLDKLQLPAKTEDWPESELWAFQAMPTLRLVEIEGLTAIDGSQTNLPAEWRHLPTYLMQSEQTILFKTLRRGDPEPAPNQLQLRRRLWLDFNGDGYTVSDTITGKMSRDWRLNATQETRLGQVLLNGMNQLITLDDEHGQGVEIRRGNLQLQADSRIQTDIGRMNAVGWQQSFQQVKAELNIPPGWRLLAVSGVDNDPSCWLTQWSLLDLFLVLITALAVGRLWNRYWGALALLCLVLIWHEADAPRWIWLNILAVLALLRAVPDSRFLLWLQWYRNLCWLALMVIVIPFMVEQVRIGIYPQLEQQWESVSPQVTRPEELAAPSVDAAMPMQAEMAEEQFAAGPAKLMRKSVSRVAALPDASVNFDPIDPNANLQTGPGLPQWHWQRIDLSWNGVVDQQQQIRLWYLPPALTLLLHVLQALLSGLLAMRLLGLIGLDWRLRMPNPGLLLVLPLLWAHVDDSRADIPDQQLLEQLKIRLLQAPDCMPNCAQLATMKVNAGRESLLLELELHAQQSLYLPLPVQLDQWYPGLIEVDGRPAQGLTRQPDRSLWLMLSAGVHKLALKGSYAERNHFTLPLPMNPQSTRVSSDGWQVDGVYENGKTGPQLEFQRIDTAIENQGQQAMPAFVEVERTLQIGLDWKVVTRIKNLSASAAPVIFELPLLTGEAILSEGIRVKDGKVVVNMPAGQSQLEWQSSLEKHEQLRLAATENSQWSEVWRADVSPIWHLQSSGIPLIQHQNLQGGWLPEWRPWPGESVELTITRPTPVAGSTMTVDKSTLKIQPGKRGENVEFSLDLRSSKGGQHTLILPADAVLQNTVIDGSTQPIRQQGGRVTLPIHPGFQQITLNWQTTNPQGMLLETPRIDLGLDSVNSHIQVILGDDRWVLLTMGPKLGPATLIWGLMAVLALLSLGLDKLPLTPLRHWQWMLLLIGLCQLHVASGLLVVGWLAALGYRANHVSQQAGWFNLLQIALGLLSLCSILLLFAAVHQGLLGTPDMQIAGNQSTASNLNWYQDHSEPKLPNAMVISTPILFYRGLMLGWALWMALSLLNWLRWGWTCFSSGGLWQQTRVIKIPKQ